MIPDRGRALVLTVVCAFAVLAAACGNNGSSAAEPATSTSTTVGPASSTSSAEVPTSSSPETTSTTTTTDEDDGSLGPTDVNDPVGTATAEADLSAFAEAIGANLVVTKPVPERRLVWHDRTISALGSFDVEFVWADGRFVYGRWGEGRGTWFQAWTPNGTLICKGEGYLHHVTERADGTYVAAVEPILDDDSYPGPGEGLPLVAEDCATGDRQPIEPLRYEGDGDGGGGRHIERVAGRVFRLDYDAEGNATVENEAGVLLNGDDYSGYAAFDPTGSLLAYGDMTAGNGPHYSSVVVGRDTTTGDRLWVVDVERPFVGLSFIDERVAVLLPDGPNALFDGEPIPTEAMILDGRTGAELQRVGLGFPLLHLS